MIREKSTGLEVEGHSNLGAGCAINKLCVSLSFQLENGRRKPIFLTDLFYDV